MIRLHSRTAISLGSSGSIENFQRLEEPRCSSEADLHSRLEFRVLLRIRVCSPKEPIWNSTNQMVTSLKQLCSCLIHTWLQVWKLQASRLEVICPLISLWLHLVRTGFTFQRKVSTEHFFQCSDCLNNSLPRTELTVLISLIWFSFEFHLSTVSLIVLERWGFSSCGWSLANEIANWWLGGTVWPLECHLIIHVILPHFRI